MGSDDPATRYKAMDGLVKGVMNTLAYDTQRYVKAQIAQAVAEVTGSITLRVQEVFSAESIKRDFFTNFPALGNPLWADRSESFKRVGAAGSSTEWWKVSVE